VPEAEDYYWEDPESESADWLLVGKAPGVTNARRTEKIAEMAMRLPIGICRPQMKKTHNANVLKSIMQPIVPTISHRTYYALSAVLDKPLDCIPYQGL
jgi:hypothetical protein